MAVDPFADDAPWNDYDAENDTNADDFAYDPDTTDTEENNDMADYVTPEQNGTEVSVTLKGGAGYDAPWVVLRAPNVETMSLMLDEKLSNLLGQAAKYGQAFSGQAAPKAQQQQRPASNNGGGQQQQSFRAPAGATQHPDGKREWCDHGEEMEYKSGISQRTGKPYAMFVCKARVPRDQQCKPKNG